MKKSADFLLTFIYFYIKYIYFGTSMEANKTLELIKIRKKALDNYEIDFIESKINEERSSFEKICNFCVESPLLFLHAKYLIKQNNPPSFILEKIEEEIEISRELEQLLQGKGEVLQLRIKGAIKDGSSMKSALSCAKEEQAYAAELEELVKNHEDVLRERLNTRLKKKESTPILKYILEDMKASIELDSIISNRRDGKKLREEIDEMLKKGNVYSWILEEIKKRFDLVELRRKKAFYSLSEWEVATLTELEDTLTKEGDLEVREMAERLIDASFDARYISQAIQDELSWKAIKKDAAWNLVADNKFPDNEGRVLAFLETRTIAGVDRIEVPLYFSNEEKKWYVEDIADGVSLSRTINEYYENPSVLAWTPDSKDSAPSAAELEGAKWLSFIETIQTDSNRNTEIESGEKKLNRNHLGAMKPEELLELKAGLDAIAEEDLDKITLQNKQLVLEVCQNRNLVQGESTSSLDEKHGDTFVDRANEAGYKTRSVKQLEAMMKRGKEELLEPSVEDVVEKELPKILEVNPDFLHVNRLNLDKLGDKIKELYTDNKRLLRGQNIKEPLTNQELLEKIKLHFKNWFKQLHYSMITPDQELFDESIDGVKKILNGEFAWSNFDVIVPRFIKKAEKTINENKITVFDSCESFTKEAIEKKLNQLYKDKETLLGAKDRLSDLLIALAYPDQKNPLKKTEQEVKVIIEGHYHI